MGILAADRFMKLATAATLLFMFWLTLVGRVTLAEALLGGAAAGSAALLAKAGREAGVAAFSFRFRWLRGAYRIPSRLLTDTAVLFGKIFTRSRTEREGALRTAPFRPGGDDPAASTRRGLAISVVTAIPNTIALGIDRENGGMLVHELAPDDGEVLP